MGASLVRELLLGGHGDGALRGRHACRLAVEGMGSSMRQCCCQSSQCHGVGDHAGATTGHGTGVGANVVYVRIFNV